jgi:small-conductance mechanosensitive channel
VPCPRLRGDFRGAEAAVLSINILWVVGLAAIVAFALMRGLQGLKLFVALIVIVVLAVLVWNVTVSLRR